jgi:hypothetical protein
MGGEIASQTFLSLMLDKIHHKEVSDSPYPMNADQVTAAIDLAKQHLTFDPLATDIISKQIADGTPVLAVGTVHNFVVQPVCQLISNVDDYYTKADLHEAISLLTNKSEAEILQLLPKVNKEHVNTQLSNLVLVYAMMDLMGIDKVKTVQASNVQGLMLQQAAKLEYKIDPVGLHSTKNAVQLGFH